MSPAPALNERTRASELVPFYAERIAGKNILVTGVSPNSLGDGFVTAVAAGKPNTLILTGRSPAKFQSVVDNIKSKHPEVTVKSLALDLGSFASVRKAAQALNDDDEVPHIDVLVLNAGLMAVGYAVTEDGFESQFQICHLSHFLLANLIMDKVLTSPGQPRIICVSSTGHLWNGVRWADYGYSDGKEYDPWHAYGQAKSANNLMAVGLAKRLGSKGKGLYAFSLHPGRVMSTGLAQAGPLTWGSLDDTLDGLAKSFNRVGGRHMKEEHFSKDADQGPATHVFAAFDPDIAKPELNGSYLLDCHVGTVYDEDVAAHSIHPELADKLWKLSEELVGQQFSY